VTEAYRVKNWLIWTSLLTTHWKTDIVLCCASDTVWNRRMMMSYWTEDFFLAGGQMPILKTFTRVMALACQIRSQHLHKTWFCRQMQTFCIDQGLLEKEKESLSSISTSIASAFPINKVHSNRCWFFTTGRIFSVEKEQTQPLSRMHTWRKFLPRNEFMALFLYTGQPLEEP
jgi:hypothetical protein